MRGSVGLGRSAGDQPLEIVGDRDATREDVAADGEHGRARLRRNLARGELEIVGACRFGAARGAMLAQYGALLGVQAHEGELEEGAVADGARALRPRRVPFERLVGEGVRVRPQELQRE